jgi:hypothetical protein
MFSQVSPKAVVNSHNSIFFEIPEKLTVDEDAKTRYSTALKIETLIQELQEKGPLVALGYMGPRCYHSEPFPLQEKFGGEQIFGWSHGTRSESAAQKTYAIVIGARKIEDKEYIYFRLSSDCTPNRKTYIREHRPTADSRVYISSHATFSDYLVDLYPPVAEEKMNPNFVSAGSTKCSLEELKYVIKLVSMPLDSILGEQESACKALGQEIFDKFKQANGNSTLAGRNAAVNICDALAFCAKDGSLRKRYVESAWDGIGDANWRWFG